LSFIFRKNGKLPLFITLESGEVVEVAGFVIGKKDGIRETVSSLQVIEASDNEAMLRIRQKQTESYRSSHRLSVAEPPSAWPGQKWAVIPQPDNVSEPEYYGAVELYDSYGHLTSQFRIHVMGSDFCVVGEMAKDLAFALNKARVERLSGECSDFVDGR
jgi:hypothetical protein